MDDLAEFRAAVRDWCRAHVPADWRRSQTGVSDAEFVAFQQWWFAELRTAGVRSAARSEPASGSEKPWTQISPPRIAGRCRWRCSSVPAASRVDAAWWIATNASTSRGASCAASSW